jgi:transposase-like protein
MRSGRNGGRRRGADERARLAAEYVKSGEGLAAFARRVGVAEASVKRWLRETGGESRARRRLVPVVMRPESAAAVEHVEVALADGTALRFPAGMAPERLAALVSAVRGVC